jgi:hypothetical protein
MIQDSVQDSTRVVVSEERYGSIIPGARAEMWRDVFLLPGARVHGAVWGNSLQVEGPGVSVDAGVYVRGGIQILPSSRVEASATDGESVTFGSAITTPDALLVDARVRFRVRIWSNLYCGRLNLRNAIVYGNVCARSAVIRNSVILGSVHCDDSLALEESVVATFQAETAKLGPRVSLLLPLATANREIALADAPGGSGAGVTVRVLFFCPLPEGEAAEAPAEEGVVTLDRSDVYQVRQPDGDEVSVLSLGQRVLDAFPLKERLRQNWTILRELALADHLEPAKREALRTRAISHLEGRLMEMVERPDISEILDASPIDDLFQRDPSDGIIQELFQRGAGLHRFLRSDAAGRT